MKRTRIALALATTLVALVAAGTALAAGPQGKVLYRFVGQLQSAPAGTSLSVSVQAGNRAALRAMLGQSQIQTFTTGDRTEFLRWSNGIPSVVTIGSLAQGETVALNIRAPRNASLAELLATAPGIVGDHGTNPQRPTSPLYLFRGTIASAANGAVTVDIRTGNRRALDLLVGQSGRQTFATGAETVFLLWQGRVPTVIDGASLKIGDDVVVRVRADKGSSLAQVVATAARRVAEHEPRAQEAAQTAQS
jgi:hypothetical protein